MDIEAPARWCASLDAASVPPATSERARLQMASMLASILCGLGTPGVREARGGFDAARRGRRRARGKSGAAAAPDLVAPWLATASMVHDFDDYLLFGHTGHSAVTVPIAAALDGDVSVGEALAAVLAANEIGGRFGGYALLGPHNGQMWTHVHLAGAVVAAARLDRDPPETLARALALAFMSPPFLLPPAFFGGSAKILCAAYPIRQALLALRLARRTDLSAPSSVFDAEHGLGRHFAYAPAAGFFEGLGEVWLTDTLAVKRVPGCAYVSAAAEAAAAVARQARAALGRAVVAVDVERIDLSVTALTMLMEEAARPHRGGPLSSVEVNFSAPLTVSLALLDDPFGAGSLDRERLRRDEESIRSVAARVSVRHDVGRTLRLIDGVVRPMALVDLLGGLSGGQGTRVGLDLLRRFVGGAGESPKSATIDRSPLDLLRDRSTLDTLRSVGRLVAEAVGRRGSGARYSVAAARPSDVRFAASAGILATIGGEVFEAECEVPAGAPGSPVDLHEVVREKLAGAFAAAGVAADADEFVGRLLGAPLDAPLRPLLEPVVPALMG